MALPKGYKHSELAKQKMSESKRGKKRTPFIRSPCSELTKIKISNSNKGKISWNKDIPMSKEAKVKSSDSHLGQHYSPQTQFKKGLIPWNKGRSFMVGEKNPGWLGGLSFLPYCHKFNNQLKEQIRERDNRSCQLCGTVENGRKLAVHHIHYDKPNCNPDLITLCIKCNSKVNFNRDYYENLFMSKN